MIGLRRLTCSACLVLAVSCSSSTVTPASRHGHLPVGIVARVGSDDISLETVQRISRAERVSLQVARDRAVRDALFAAEAHQYFGSGEMLPVLERAANSRALLTELKRDALARGAASDAELAEQTALRWRELDRPASARTSHAVVLVEKPSDESAARSVAQAIFEATRGSKDPDEFVRQAQAVPHGDLQVRAERLPAVTADGRVYDPDKPTASSDQTFDPDFAKAANALAVGQISEPTKSRFGYHVILCEAHLPELRLPLEERRRLVHDEVVKARAERAKQELLARLSAAAPIPISRAVEDLTARVRVEE